MTNSINTFGNKFYKGVGIFFSFVIIVYGVTRTLPVLRGVDIKINNIEASENSYVVNITGNVNHAKDLLINGRQVTTSVDGDFETDVILTSGINKVKIVAKDIRGKNHEKDMTFFSKENSSNENKTALLIDKENIIINN